MCGISKQAIKSLSKFGKFHNHGGAQSMGAIDLSAIGELSGLLAWGAALLYGGALVLIGCVLHRIQ